MDTTKLLTATSTVIKVDAYTVSGNYKYVVSYETSSDGKTLTKAVVSIYTVEGAKNVAIMGLDMYGNSNCNFTSPDVSRAEAIAMFDSIIAEIKSDLTA
jgi:hypothetical protein